MVSHVPDNALFCILQWLLPTMDHCHRSLPRKVVQSVSEPKSGVRFSTNRWMMLWVYYEFIIASHLYVSCLGEFQAAEIDSELGLKTNVMQEFYVRVKADIFYMINKSDLLLIWISCSLHALGVESSKSCFVDHGSIADEIDGPTLIILVDSKENIVHCMYFDLLLYHARTNHRLTEYNGMNSILSHWQQWVCHLFHCAPPGGTPEGHSVFGLVPFYLTL